MDEYQHLRESADLAVVDRLRRSVQIVALGIQCIKTGNICLRYHQSGGQYLQWYDANRKVAVCPGCWHQVMDHA